MIDAVEIIGYASIFAGSAVIGFATPYCIAAYKRYRGRKRFDAFIGGVVENMHQKRKEALEKSREVSEFTYRDQDRQLQTVKIIIDPSINPECITEEDREGLNVMEFSKSGPISGAPDELKKVKEFVFSAKAVEDMRKSGIEPEDMVVRMLKAVGRME